MTSERAETPFDWLPRFGEFLVALLMVYSAVMHYKFATFVAQIVPPWMPWRLFWAYFTGSALLAAGLSIAVRRQVRLAATLLGLMLFLFVLLIHTPSMVRSITHQPQDVRVLWSFNGTGGVNNALKDLALTVSALMIAVAQAKDRTPSRQIQAFLLSTLFTVVIVLFGIEHFFFTRYTPGIPSWSFVSFWIPRRSFWGYGTGVFMLCAGLMILAKKREREAANVLGFVILVVAAATYFFRMAAGMGNYGELTNTMKDVAVAGGAFILAGILESKSLAIADMSSKEITALGR